MTRASDTPAPCGGSTRGAALEPGRLVLVPGLETASGAPVVARLTGSQRQPVLRAMVSFAALAAARDDGGAA